MKNLNLFIALTLFSLTPSSLFSQTTTSFEGLYECENNWCDHCWWTNGLPQPGVDAVIPDEFSAAFIGDGWMCHDIIADFDIYNDGVLLIKTGATLTNLGTIYNGPDGEIIVEGTLLNELGATINNEGTITVNSGSIENNGNIINNGIGFGRGIYNNLGWIHNLENFDNFGHIDNDGIISNLGTLNNEGDILNWWEISNCYGTYIGNPPTINPLQEDEAYCPGPEICDGLDNNSNGEIDEDCGCTNLLAYNYDPTAIFNDGSCIMYGCNQISACNYDPLAIGDDGSCEFLSCGGCTWETACNYDVVATVDDGSCEYTSCAGCTYPTSPDYDPAKTLDDGSCTFEPSVGCTGDLNGDLEINTSDLLAFLSVFGGSCAP
jgi:hypothetical protein